MAYENYTIDQFMKAWFKKDYSNIKEDEFNTVYTEYIDTAGLYNSEDFEKVAYIYFLNNRINCIKIGIESHKKFIEEFSVPFIDNFEFFANKLGHILKWRNDKEDFLKQLDLVEVKERVYTSKLELKLDELKKSREKRKNENQTEKQTRHSIIRTINSLGKIGYAIDKSKTTVEEFSLMIKQQTEEIEELNSRQ